MNERTAPTGKERVVGSVFLVNSGELLIEAPIERVWKYVLDYASWQNFPIVQHVSGEVGEEGEVVRLRKEEQGFAFPSYYARTIKLEPERRVVWKTYPEPGTQEMDFFGFVDFRVAEAQGKTLFSYNSTYEFQVPYQDESELEIYRKQQQANFQALFAVVFPKLKEVAEAGR